MSSFLSGSWVRPINLTAAPSSRPSFPQPQRHCLQFSCTAINGDENQNTENAQTRRHVLIGLGSGGLYGAANLASNPIALADPIPAPDLKKCVSATNPVNQDKIACCPPVTDNIVDYKLPQFHVERFRPAAHMVTLEYLCKYKIAVDQMRRLPKDDPRSFMQQANVHCAYCNSAYQYPFGPGQEPKEIQVHKSWLFFPFHRWYLYFYERILGSLINDPTFGLPFWNYDGSPSGMTIPPMYLEKGSPLYDHNRNPNHLGSIVDLAYRGKDRDNVTPEGNWRIMRDEMIDKAHCIESFMGLPFKKCVQLNPGEGTVERGSHTSLHSWGGGIKNPPEHTGEDLGNFYSAGRDPLFFALHANVDRLWTIWRDSRGNKRKDIDDKDYLNAEFLFYDENKQLVRVKVGDCLEQDKMGYRFQTEGVYMPWKIPSISLLKRSEPRNKPMVARTLTAPKVDTVQFPLKLDKVAKFLVQRPKKSRTQEEKETEEEILEILAEVDTQEFAKFDVFVDDEDENEENLNRDEYAGTFAQIPQSRGKDPSKGRTSIRLELTRQLEDLNVEDDDEILVALVPRAGDVDIADIKIIYSPS